MYGHIVGDEMKNRKFRYLIIGIIAITIFFSLKIINDYRERNLVDLISYKPTDYYSLGFTKDRNNVAENKAFEWFSKDKEPTDELMEFLSQYRVKRINEESFNENLNNEELFEFTISHSNENPAIVWILENRVHIFVGNYYEVINGPIDMEWIRKYNEKYRELYGE